MRAGTATSSTSARAPLSPRCARPGPLTCAHVAVVVLLLHRVKQEPGLPGMHQAPAAPAQAWAWDKVAQMVKLLDETPPEQAEWILFMQPDTVIDDVGFTFPFEFYQVRIMFFRSIC